MNEQKLLLGEWACLGILYQKPLHGFAVAAQLKPENRIGGVWSMSRALTYRCLDQLRGHGYIEAIAEEPGIAGGTRTVLAATRSGRAALRHWLHTPVAHLRDLRSELLLKLLIAEHCGVDVAEMLVEQRVRVEAMAAALRSQADESSDDVVALWRAETSSAALRFLDRVVAAGG